MTPTATVTVTLDTKKLDEYARNIGRTADQAVEAIAIQGRNEVQAVITEKDIIDTEALRESITWEKISDMLWMVRDGVEYGIYQEFGSVAHDIYPVAKKALWWPKAAHPVKVVHHPGNAPRPFMLVGVLRATQHFAVAVGEWCFPEAQI
jgi:hypothetical protein